MSPSIKFMEKYSANYDGLVLLWGISRSSAALFPGTKKELVQELEAWLDRRQRHEKEVKELRMRSQASSQYLHDATKDIPSHKKAAVLRTMEQGEKDTARVEVSDDVSRRRLVSDPFSGSKEPSLTLSRSIRVSKNRKRFAASISLNRSSIRVSPCRTTTTHPTQI